MKTIDLSGDQDRRNSEQDLLLELGEQLEVVLNWIPSSGCSWILAALPEGLECLGMEWQKGEWNGTGEVTGNEGFEHFLFRLRHGPGGELRLEYRQPWEEPILRHCIIRVSAK